MSNKIKIQKETLRLHKLATNCGLILMAGAATFGMVDFPQPQDNKSLFHNRPAYALAYNNLSAGSSNNMRREREEVAPHYLSFGEVQRSVARSGKV